MPPRPIRVLLCDDSAIFRLGTAIELEGSGDIEVITSVGCTNVALSLADQLRPDVIITDLFRCRCKVEAKATMLRLEDPSEYAVLTSGITMKKPQ